VALSIVDGFFALLVGQGIYLAFLQRTLDRASPEDCTEWRIDVGLSPGFALGGGPDEQPAMITIRNAEAVSGLIMVLGIIGSLAERSCSLQAGARARNEVTRVLLRPTARRITVALALT
jgi:hypothetical protein